MNAAMALVCVALAAGLVAGCDKTNQESDSAKPVVVPKTGSAELQPPISPTASAQASEMAKSPPVQGQVDAKDPAQKRDFQSK